MQISRFLLRRAGAICLFVALLAAILFTARNEGAASQSPKKRSDMVLQQVMGGDLAASRLKRQARQIALADPMHAVGFFLEVMALDLEKVPLSAGHGKLIAEASRRQPSFAAPRIWLVGDDIRKQRYAEAIDGSDAVMRLNSEFRKLLVPILLPLLNDEKARPLLERKLQTFPIWRTEFVAEAIKTGGYETQVERLLRQKAPANAQRALAAERSAYLQKLVANGEPERASTLWQSFVPDAGRTGMFDGDFKARYPIYPFAWQFVTDPYSYAEKIAGTNSVGPMIRIHHGGDRKVTLLSQLVALKPGTRMLTFTMRDGGLAEPDKLFWRVRCMGATDYVASRSLAKLAADWQKVKMRVEIPANGCALQYLMLAAENNDSKEAEVEIRLVEVG